MHSDTLLRVVRWILLIVRFPSVCSHFAWSIIVLLSELLTYVRSCVLLTCCKVANLFYELREPILLTASWLTLRTQLKLEMRPDINVYKTLSSVCDAFHEVVRDRRCRRILRRTLKGLSHFTQQQCSIDFRQVWTSDVKTAALINCNIFSCDTVVSCWSYAVHYAPLMFGFTAASCGKIWINLPVISH